MAGKANNKSMLVEDIDKEKETENKEENIYNDVEKERITKLQNEKDELVNQLKQMQKQMAELRNQTNIKVHDPYSDVTVISLVNGILNLSTGERGTGRLYTFSKFGTENEIAYNDLKMVLQSYRKNFERGDCYINNPEIVKSLGLSLLYENILSKDKIEMLLKCDRETFKKIYSTIPQSQQETIAELLIQKMANNEYVDLNVIGLVKETTNKDVDLIVEQYKEMKKYE